MKQRPQSQKTYETLCSHIPGGVNSPARACTGLLSPPMVASHGKQDLIYDVDGNAYIDYCGSWGALIHGHAHPAILEAVQKRAALGTSFGITTAIEGELAAQINKLMPSIEKMRFVSSGTEATMSAIRLARGYTKRDMIIKFSGNYHGHADFFLVQAGSGVANLPQSSSSGIPESIVKHTFSLPYNDIETCYQVIRKWQDKVACIIVEPIAGNMGVVPAEAAFLKMLREESSHYGIVLIFDEVISGFRVALGGAQELYQIVPDLTCLGKIMGGGFPAAAFGGKKEIMECLAPLGSVYQAGTLSGNPIAMEAGLQALKMLEAPHFYSNLTAKSDLITQPLQELFEQKKIAACIQQVGSMFTLFFGKNRLRNMEEARLLDNEMFAQFFRYMFEHGVYIPPSQYEAWFVSQAHTEEHLNHTSQLIVDFFK